MTSTSEILIQDIIDNTNSRIDSWYKTVKEDYNVIGSGKARYSKEEDSVIVDYVENGIAKTWKMAFFPEYISNGINWVFSCWSELG